ncbi:MAG: FHA domain-containing protein [Vicinamibacteria bacterium]|nr:FHA domain-containing protein [Vicinamibacteria bacterium]
MRFEIRHPSHREEVSSESDFVVFGRDPSCDIVIKNPRCSRRHASVRVVPEGYHLLDMGSSNGVYVLGQKIDDAIIREGDVFSMGDVFVRILPEDMPATLAMPQSRGDATVMQSRPPIEPARRVPPPPLRRAETRAPAPASLSASALAPRVLAVSSLATGIALIVGPLSLGPQLGVLAYVVPVFGVFSTIAGLGLLGGFRWARSIHYALFTIWTLTCLLAPFGVIGFAYQLRGEDRPETDSFFSVVIGIAGALAVIALIAAVFLARIYVPAPLPL